MSWNVCLKDKDGNLVEVEKFEDGGTYLVGGSTEACLNITYNYSRFYYEYLDKKNGIRWLDDREAEKCIDKLLCAFKELGIERGSDYWAPTPGNAGYALSILLKWSQDNPDAVFEVL